MLGTDGVGMHSAIQGPRRHRRSDLYLFKMRALGSLGRQGVISRLSWAVCSAGSSRHQTSGTGPFRSRLVPLNLRVVPFGFKIVVPGREGHSRGREWLHCLLLKGKTMANTACRTTRPGLLPRQQTAKVATRTSNLTEPLMWPWS
jgi:hypothetical protein